MMIEQNTNYAYKIKYMGNPTFDKVRDLSTKFYLELPQGLKDELYEALHRGIDILDSEPQMTAYIFAYGKMHQAKLNYAFDKLSDNFFGHDEINIIDYGCGQAIGTMCYADFLHKNGYSQKAKSITLIEPSEICLKRAALHTSVFFPDAEIKTVNKGFNDLNENDIICSEETPTLHILSNVLDILNFDIYNFAELIKKNLKGKNQFVCVAPYYNGNEKDNRMDLFASKINGSNIITRKYKANEFIPEKEWTCKISCFQKNIGSFEMIEDSGLNSPISAAPQMTDEPHSIDYAITSIKELREEGFNVIHITSQKDNKNYLKIIKGSRFILLEDKISKTISDDAPLKVSIWHYNDNGKIRTVSLGKIENLDIENPNSEDLEQHTIYYEADEKIESKRERWDSEIFDWIDKNSISHNFSKGKGKIKLMEGVNVLGKCAFYGCRELTYINIPNSVTKIEQEAFFGCSGLTYINIPNSMIKIERNAFVCCNGLTAIYYNGDIAGWCGISFGEYDEINKFDEYYRDIPLYNAHNLYIGNKLVTNLIIPDIVIEIKPFAFCGATCLTSVTIPNSIMRIGACAFYGCSGLTSINIPDSVTIIASSAFEGCSKLNSILIPDSVTKIESYAFKDCIGLNSIVIPNSVTEIEPFAFDGCTGLMSINIPDSVTTIGEYAFRDCSSLTSINIPNSVTSIGWGAFRCCSGLTCIFVAKGNKTYDSRNNCNAIIETKTNKLIAGCKNTTIPDSITKIERSAFRGCTLTAIKIPSSVIEIGLGAFSCCYELANIHVHKDNTIYDSRNDCNAIIETKTNKLIAGCVNTNIPYSVTEIEGFAFEGCNGLTSISIPDNVTRIGDNAFSHCNNLTIVVFNAKKCTYMGTDTYFYDYPTYPTDYHVFYDCDSLTTLKIGNNVTRIPAHAFGGCCRLTSVNIPNSVTEIGNEAFYGCNNLPKEIKEKIERINGDAFTQRPIDCDY